MQRARHAYVELPYAVSSAPQPPAQPAPSSYAGTTGYGGGTRKRIGDVLVEAGVLTQADLERALGAQRADGAGERKRLGEIITDLGFASERQVAQALRRARPAGRRPGRRRRQPRGGALAAALGRRAYGRARPRPRTPTAACSSPPPTPPTWWRSTT